MECRLHQAQAFRKVITEDEVAVVGCLRGGSVMRQADSASEKLGVFRKRAPPGLTRPAKCFAPFRQLMFDSISTSQGSDI
ncbi:hypothetical protein [Arthrobacter sp. YAF16]|uniref:hypothetical protein n=1 Tax=Arthrobacter sp. YAF16 TaxID=3233076 RepID=UPI003F8F4DB9